MSLQRLAGASGLVFVTLVTVANLAQGAAGRPFGDPEEAGYLSDYLAYYADGGWVLTLLGFVLPFVWVGLALFAVGLTVALVRSEWRQAGEAWSLLGLAGVVMQNAIFPVVVAMDAGQFRFVADEGTMDLSLHHAHEVLFGLNSISLAIALVGFSAAMVRARAGVRWLPRIGFVAAALLGISTMNLGFSSGLAVFDGVGLLGFVLWLVFIAASSVWLLRHTGRPNREPDAPTMQEA